MSLQKFSIFHRAKIAKAVLWSLLIPALFFFLPQTTANAVDGNALVKWSNEYRKYSNDVNFSNLELGLFLGYVQGVNDSIMYFTEYTKLGDPKVELLRISKSPLYNSTGGVPLQQVIEIVEKFLKDNPDKWDSPAFSLVKNALFPF
ncbi:MAG: hypothetical protein M0R49_08010 [Limnochordia bacterium]|nr:hypothetical protein [Limnochordia bacterium]